MSSFTPWAAAATFMQIASRNAQSSRGVIEEQVIGILKEFNAAGVEIRPDHILGKDLNLDPLANVEFAMRLEDQFRIAILNCSKQHSSANKPALDLTKSVDQVVDLVLERL